MTYSFLREDTNPEERPVWKPARLLLLKTLGRLGSGFGDPEKELWLGLATISELTKTGNWELRVDLVDFEGVNYTAFYSNFQVEEEPLFRLRISGFDEEMSTVEDTLSQHDGM